jgi:iron transport multicopper oxidase
LRYDVLITGKSNPTRNYAIKSIMTDAGLSTSGILRYSSKFPAPSPNDGNAIPTPVDHFTLSPADGEKIFTPVNQTIILPVNYGGTASRRYDRTHYRQCRTPAKIPSRIFLGNDSYTPPKVPTLYTAITTGTAALNPIVYGPAVNPYVIETGQVVQIIVENHDDTEHPMHLHGYEFQVVARGTGSWDGNESKLPKVPMRRDTVTTPPSGYLVIRIRANNPGVWMFHCHMEFHGRFSFPPLSSHGVLGVKSHYKDPQA